MATQLKNLRVREISLVDAPANAGARVLLFKRDAAMEPAGFWKKDYKAEQRREMAASGAAMPDGSYPIADAEDLHDAIRAVGRGRNNSHGAIRRHIMRRAKALGLEKEIPETWKASGEAKKGLVAKVAEWLGIAKALDFDTAQAAQETGEYAQGMLAEFDEAMCALRQSVCSIMCDDQCPDKQAAIAETFAQFKQHIQGVVPEGIENAMRGAALAAAGLGVNPQGALVDKGAGSMTEEEKRREEERKAKEKEHEDTKKALAVAKREIAMLKMSERHKAYHDKLDGAEKEKFADMTPAERDDHMDKNPIEKRLPPEIAKELAEAEDVKKRLAALENERSLADFTKRAAELGIGEAHGVTLQKAYAGDKAAVDALLGLVKASTAQARAAGIFKEFGATGATGANASAYDQLVAKAEELRKADPKLSREGAFARVYADPANADLAKRERRENRPAAA